MKAKTRKRLLISSIAMLLVAMLALGTATFAWFTTSTTARADQLQVKTIKASELEISKTTGDWSDTIHYGFQNEVLKPASTINGVNWFKADAQNKTASTYEESTVTELSDLDGYVFKEQLNVRNKGAAAVNNVTISFSINENEAANGKYFRLALVPVNERGASATASYPTGKSFADYVYAAAADSAAGIQSVTRSGAGTEADPYTYTIATQTISAASGASVSFEVGNLAGAVTSNGSTTYDAKYYNLYVWFEGQDTDCKDPNAGNSINAITFTVSGETVQA